ncbi:outer membrane protein transport protein [Candidatus Poribacteria bacterium]|nr:outer membrane protein transport protein [Candidatus Poribacteria bacterium]
MRRTIYHVFVCLFAIGLFAVTSTAQIEEMAIGNTFGVGARTMGMGGATLGISDDFTALYWNPAGMAQIQKFEFFTSFSHNTANTDSFFSSDEVTGTSRTQLRPNAIGFIYPFYTQQGGFAVGFGYNRPQNFDYQTAIQGIDSSSGNLYSGLLVDEVNRNSGGLGIWSFGGSIYITESILIGGAVDFWNGNSINELETSAVDAFNIDNDISRFRFDDEIDRVYSGVGGKIGVLVNFTETISLGVTLVSPTELTVEELWNEYTVVSYDDGEEVTDPNEGSTSYDIERPFEIGTGVALKLLNQQLILAGDIQLTDWRQTRYDPAPAEDITHDYFEETYSLTLQSRLGIEFRIPGIDTHIRAGYFRDTIPFTETDVENERDYLTLGIGKIFEETLKFDLAYMYGNWRQYSNELTRKENNHRVFVSGAYRF